jgi:hypothetical protein
MMEYLKDWWLGRLNRTPLQGKLTDFASLVGRYNRTLSQRLTTSAPSVVTTVAANSNRVAISVWAQYNPATAAADTRFRWLDNASNIILEAQMVTKEADIAAVTPSPFVIIPYYADALTIGPLVQNQFALVSGPAQLFAVELLCNPELSSD